ncbi:MAG: flippase-like domain-containing protein [Bacteroidales bacterium]|nr:flippase-like domain-containing protein [Bacteroidales bacterium]
MTSKVHKTLNILLRLIIVLLSLGFIYWKIFAKGEIQELRMALESFGSNSAFFEGLIIVMLLMLANWGIEAIKWKRLVSEVENISFIKAFQSVITGVTVSIFTPNRTGEFIGRAFILKKGDPLQAVLLTLVGSFSQLLVTLLAGSVALAFTYRLFLPAGVLIPAWTHVGIMAGLLSGVVILITIFLSIPEFTKFLETKFKTRLKRISFYLQALQAISRKELILILSLSFLRYFVFSLQFYLMLLIFGVFIPLSSAILLIPVIFITLAVIPTIALSEIGVRSSVSLFFIGEYILQTRGVAPGEKESLAIIMAACLLWVINLAIPAIAGVPFVFKLRFFRK